MKLCCWLMTTASGATMEPALSGLAMLKLPVASAMLLALGGPLGLSPLKLGSAERVVGLCRPTREIARQWFTAEPNLSAPATRRVAWLHGFYK